MNKIPSLRAQRSNPAWIAASRRALLAMTLIGVVCGLSACGNKGRLKSPAQIEVSEAKKERKRAKAEMEKEAPAPESPVPAEKE